ncbi:Acyl-CoA N-acyltransferase [Penicillium chermesinum]|nr:Acyl-CoA N-acyltransferase [Penicillium chermesinum]
MDPETELLPFQEVEVLIPSPGPSIESDRLLLRPVAKRDTPALYAIRADPEVAKTKSSPKTPFQSIKETEDWLAGKIFSMGPGDIIGRSFNYAILDKSIPESQEQVIGYISINAVHPCPEIGYSLAPKAWGQGFATEALELFLKMWWALPRRDREQSGVKEGDVEKIWAISEKQNKGSSRVLEKCGFEMVGEAKFEKDELYKWALQRPNI